MKKVVALLALMNVAFALEPADQDAIHTVIQTYTHAWNALGCKGFADGFTEDADFVNIFGMKFTGKEEIEERHVKILQTFFKGSKLEILATQLREVQPSFVIATVPWRLHGFRAPGSDNTLPGEVRDGIFTQVFIKSKDTWKITASQNTLVGK